MKKKTLIKWTITALVFIVAATYAALQTENYFMQVQSVNKYSRNYHHFSLVEFLEVLLGMHPASLYYAGDERSQNPISSFIQWIFGSKTKTSPAVLGSEGLLQRREGRSSPQAKGLNNSGTGQTARGAANETQAGLTLNGEGQGNFTSFNNQENTGNDAQRNATQEAAATAQTGSSDNSTLAESAQIIGNGNANNNGPDNNPGSQPNNPSTETNAPPKICVLGCYPGCDPSCDSACVAPGCLLSGINPANLTIINPIPSDPVVSQNIAQHNQASTQLAQLAAQNQQLEAQVLESAQASKYQSVDPNKIPGPDNSPAPSDFVNQIKSGQLIQR